MSTFNVGYVGPKKLLEKVKREHCEEKCLEMDSPFYGRYTEWFGGFEKRFRSEFRGMRKGYVQKQRSDGR